MDKIEPDQKEQLNGKPVTFLGFDEVEGTQRKE